MKYLIILLYAFLVSCFDLHCDDLRIYQEVSACDDENHFQVETWVNSGCAPSNVKTIYSVRTWEKSNFKCLLPSQVDSAKTEEYKKAETFIKNYKSIK